MQEVLRLKSLRVSDDGSHVDIFFDTDADEVVLRFPLDIMNVVASDLSSAHMMAKKIRGPDLGIIEAIEPAQIGTRMSALGEKVILTFVLTSGLETHYAIPVSNAKTLIERLSKITSST